LSKLQIPIFIISSLWQHDRGEYNVLAATENFLGERLSHKRFSGNLKQPGEMWAKYPLHT